MMERSETKDEKMNRIFKKIVDVALSNPPLGAIEISEALRAFAPIERGSNHPYLVEYKIETIRSYNPEYGGNRICKCGHPYDRHFDSYNGMEDIGCKYCRCRDFEEINISLMKENPTKWKTATLLFTKKFEKRPDLSDESHIDILESMVEVLIYKETENEED